MVDTARTITRAELPGVITTNLEAHRTRDLDIAVGSYTTDAAVTDEGRTHHGRDAIRLWLSRAASEFTYTTTMTGATKIDDDHYDVRQHLEGNFPGGQVDLHFRFTLRDGLIAALVIEP